ncbi:MAG: aspartate/glutamate racemase family protein [Coriobacteriia bacterium]|nr:aspartate/glutamate racemase family protein [Coriobacteriia bacterium]
MKTIGLIGGMSWESTVPYYRRINELVSERLGGLHSARMVMLSVDFAEVAAMQNAGEWDKAGRLLADGARALEAAGADFLVLATNTMHKVAPAIEEAAGIPLLHIADTTGEVIKTAGIGTVGLLGTRFTMEQEFYRDRLTRRHGLTVLTPHAEDRAFINHTIYTELCCGTLSDSSRDAFRDVITRLVERGAGGIILGCTEIPLLVGPGDSPVPLFDTGELHVRAAVDRALDKQTDTGQGRQHLEGEQS